MTNDKDINENLMKLFEQVWPDPTIKHDNHMKLAELLVRECAKIADEHYDKGFCPVGGFIKEHFGVE